MKKTEFFLELPFDALLIPIIFKCEKLRYEQEWKAHPLSSPNTRNSELFCDYFLSNVYKIGYSLTHRDALVLLNKSAVGWVSQSY